MHIYKFYYNILLKENIIPNSLKKREYENFADYTKNMADSVAEVIGTVSDPVGTKKPFGIKFTKDNEKFHLFLKSDGMYSWLALKRI